MARVGAVCPSLPHPVTLNLQTLPLAHQLTPTPYTTNQTNMSTGTSPSPLTSDSIGPRVFGGRSAVLAFGREVWVF